MFKVIKNNAAWLLTSLMVAVFMLVLAELGAQFYYSAFKPRTALIIDTELFHYHPAVVHTIRPNAEVRLGQRQAVLYGYFGEQTKCAKDGVVFKINSHGFRTPELSTFGPKAKNEVRIIIVGGSASISWAVGEACTLDAQLQKVLSKQYPDKKIVIINLGSGAWKSFQELNSVQRYGLPLDPDLIIAFDSFNDISHSVSMDVLQAYGEGHNKTAFRDYYNKYHNPVQYAIDALMLPKLIRQLSAGMATRAMAQPSPGPDPALVRESERHDADAPVLAKRPAAGSANLATRAMSYPLDLAKVRERTDFTPYAEHVMKTYTDNVGMMAKSASLFDAKLLVFMQPNVYLRQTPSADEKRNYWRKYARFANYIAYTHLISLERLRELANDISNLYVEDGNNFTMHTKEFIFGDDCHMGEFGYSLMAKGVAESIEKNSLLN